MVRGIHPHKNYHGLHGKKGGEALLVRVQFSGISPGCSEKGFKSKVDEVAQ